MTEFLQNYGLWILLGVIFLAMNWFGLGCCGGGHSHRRDAGKGDTGAEKKVPEQVSRKTNSCH